MLSVLHDDLSCLHESSRCCWKINMPCLHLGNELQLLLTNATKYNHFRLCCTTIHISSWFTSTTAWLAMDDFVTATSNAFCVCSAVCLYHVLRLFILSCTNGRASIEAKNGKRKRTHAFLVYFSILFDLRQTSLGLAFIWMNCYHDVLHLLLSFWACFHLIGTELFIRWWHFGIEHLKFFLVRGIILPQLMCGQLVAFLLKWWTRSLFSLGILRLMNCLRFSGLIYKVLVNLSLVCCVFLEKFLTWVARSLLLMQNIGHSRWRNLAWSCFVTGLQINFPEVAICG